MVNKGNNEPNVPKRGERENSNSKLSKKKLLKENTDKHEKTTQKKNYSWIL